MDHPFQSPAILSLCTGIRGLERGLERAIGPVRPVAYVEIEAFIIANLLAGMEAGILVPAPVWANLKTFDARPFCGKIHGIVGGYPCQPFSLAGQRKGTSDPRHLWPYIQQIIDTIRPVWCFFENVDDHLSMGFDEVYRSLADMGYRVEAGVFSAEEVGAPHQRQRLFILAMANATSQRSGKSIAGRSPKFDHQNTQIMAHTCKYDGWPICRPFSQQEFYRTSHGSDRWPARPSELQQEWEHSRTAKPGVGCSIDGYNFREDLLRAFGNGVVEQTAELAFRTLLQKFYK